jgi:hypothetical protein
VIAALESEFSPGLKPAARRAALQSQLAETRPKSTKIYRAHKIRLDPNREQEVFFRKCLGVVRVAFNWALTQWKQESRTYILKNVA